MSDQVIRGSAHFNQLAGDAWKARALAAEARVKELESILAAAGRVVQGVSSPAVPANSPVREGEVPGSVLPPPPGTRFFSGGGSCS